MLNFAEHKSSGPSVDSFGVCHGARIERNRDGGAGPSCHVL